MNDPEVHAEYMKNRAMIEDFMRSVEDRMPPGRLDAAWELWGQSEVGPAMDVAFDALDDLAAPLTEEEVTKLAAIFDRLKNLRDAKERRLAWARSCGRNGIKRT